MNAFFAGFVACAHAGLIVFILWGFVFFRRKTRPHLVEMHRIIALHAFAANFIFGRCPLTVLQEHFSQQDDPEFSMRHGFIGSMFECFDIAWLPTAVDITVGILSVILSFAVVIEEGTYRLRRKASTEEKARDDAKPQPPAPG